MKDRDLVAAPWIPDPSLSDSAGRVRPEFLWAALDCPGYFGLHMDRDPALMLLGTLVARIDGSIEPGEHCVVIGWDMGQEGRKHYAGTALFSSDGRLCGEAMATWIALDQPASWSSD